MEYFYIFQILLNEHPLILLVSSSLGFFLLILNEHEKIKTYFFLLSRYCKPYAHILWRLFFIVGTIAYIYIVDEVLPPNFKLTFVLVLMPDRTISLIWATYTSKYAVYPLILKTDPLALIEVYEMIIPLDMLIIYQWSTGVIILLSLVFRNQLSFDDFMFWFLCYLFVLIIFFYSCCLYVDLYS